jgi:hypothetical protein
MRALRTFSGGGCVVADSAVHIFCTGPSGLGRFLFSMQRVGPMPDAGGQREEFRTNLVQEGLQYFDLRVFLSASQPAPFPKSQVALMAAVGTHLKSFVQVAFHPPAVS